MLRNIDLNKMNRLMEENEDARTIIKQLLENHHTSVSTISHEIRNPLTLISSSLQIMEIQHPEVKDFSNWSSTMNDMQFLCSLLEDLSTFNNGTKLKPSVFHLGKLLKNIAISFVFSLDAEDSDIEFSSSISPKIGEITGDKIKLEEVLLNLLKNAKESIHGEGSIFLSAEQNGDTIIIHCKDTGCGIPEEHLETLFDPFVTHKPNGTGLGLSLSKRIIEAHQGTISVLSKPGEGTEFTITLPA